MGDRYARVFCAEVSSGYRKWGGVYEIRRHTEGKKHSDYARAAASQAPITAAFHVSPAVEARFYQSVRTFYETSV